MITNKSITYYKKGLDSNKLTIWTRYIFNKVWVFGSKSSNINKGYGNANNVEIRIPMSEVKNAELFKIGDIVAIGNQDEITKQSDLDGKEFYNITSINVNNFGNNPHIHLGGQ